MVAPVDTAGFTGVLEEGLWGKAVEGMRWGRVAQLFYGEVLVAVAERVVGPDGLNYDKDDDLLRNFVYK